MNVFDSNAAKLRELNAAINKTVERRHEGPAQREAWGEACRRFHESYDELAFPGGLGKASSLLPAKDPGTIELAVQFLEADPWFFRSGYIKETLIKHLRRVPLNDDQKKRLQQTILARVQGPNTPREFRSYCKLARIVADSAFQGRIIELADSSVPVISKHAQLVIAQLMQR